MTSGRRRDPSTTFEGTPCARAGHTLRYKNGNGCVECQLARSLDPIRKAAAKEAAARHRANPNNTVKLRYLKQRYGLSVEEYQAMEKAQSGLCKICHGPPRGRWSRLHVDHDHKTGKVRGLLCYACNTLLGHANDNPATLQAAVNYLTQD